MQEISARAGAASFAIANSKEEPSAVSATLDRASVKGTLVLVLCVIAGQMTWTPAAATDLAKEQRRGYQAAAQYCHACHAIGRTDKSPTYANSHTAFRDLHLRYPIKVLRTFCETGHLAGHDEMPAFLMTTAMSRALLSYIDSLQPAGKPRYVDKNLACERP